MDFVITIYRGDTPTLEFTFVDEETGQPLNLSGWTLYFAAKKSDDNSLFIDKQMTVLDPLSGTAYVALTAEETNNVGRHVAEIEARQGNDIATLAQGLLIIRRDIRA